MARDPRTATATLAHVALRIACDGCHTGPDEVHLRATIFGRQPATFGGDVVWTMSLVTRPSAAPISGGPWAVNVSSEFGEIQPSIS